MAAPDPWSRGVLREFRGRSVLDAVPSPRLITLLLRTGLMRVLERPKTAEGKAVPYEGELPSEERVAQGRLLLQLTGTGYGFLLKPAELQVWTLLRAYLTALDRSSRARAVRLLLQLPHVPLGSPVDAEVVCPDLELRTDLEALGILVTGEDSSQNRPWLAVSPLARAITYSSTSSSSPSSSSSEDTGTVLTDTGGWVRSDTAHAQSDASAGMDLATATDAFAPEASALSSASTSLGALQIVVEKNFRVFAYSSHRLHARLLALFARVHAVLPNLIVARITRTSARAAFARSLSADNILEFLRAHPHPDAALGVPENVDDALHIWEAENDRITHTDDCMLLTNFRNDAEYQTMLQALQAQNLVRATKQDDTNSYIVASPSEIVREIAKKHRETQ